MMALAGDPGVVLIVEDNPGDRDLLVAQVEEADSAVRMLFAETLAEATETVRAERIDAVFLDLGLPDAQGLDTFDELHAVDPHLPVLVMTGLDREATAMQAIRSGADEYLVKGRVEPARLQRALRTALERGRKAAKLEDDRRRIERDRAALAQLAISSPAASDAAPSEAQPSPLREANPDIFEDLVVEYAEALELSLESWSVRAGVATRLRTIAGIAGSVRAGVADLVDMHRAGVERALASRTPGGAYALERESDFILLELMGHAASFYRARVGPGQEETVAETSAQDGG